ncbi:MAG: hypothetical protein WB676_09000 [Bryobacteraceae bacterium]
MPITQEEFERAYPTLFHISLARDVEQVRRHGLLSTTALLDLCEIQGEQRTQIERMQRPKPIPIRHPVFGDFLINDQAPMNLTALSKCLTDLTTTQWCESLNRRVFLWPTRDRLAKHIGARLAGRQKRVVLAFETRSLLKTLRADAFELSPINSGNTMRKAAPRGSGTFLKFGEYPFHERRRTKGLRAAIAEVTYPYAITAAELMNIGMSVEVLA